MKPATQRSNHQQERVKSTNHHEVSHQEIESRPQAHLPTSPPASQTTKCQSQPVFQKQASSTPEITVKEAIKSPDKSLRFQQSHLYI
jgi:hypothetical protein